MGAFDLKTFLEVAGRGGGPVQALGTSFGMPSCLLNLTDDALNLLPSSLLGGIRGSSSNGVNLADDVIKASLAKMRWLNGIIEFDTEEGTFRFVSDSSKDGIDKDEGGFLRDLGGFLGAAGAAAGFAGRMYRNYQTVSNQIEGIADCIRGYKNYLDFEGGSSGNQKEELSRLDPAAYDALLESEFGADKRNILNAQNFINQANRLNRSIDRILRRRQEDPGLEPEFTEDFAELVADTTFKVATPDETPQNTEVFRLLFGPPKSSFGQFILSQDGLYYDSQTSGIVPALLEVNRRKDLIDPGDRWKFDYDPNLGGRGKGMSSRDLALYVNTILDPDKIDELPFIQNYYDKDGFLQDLIGQKNKRLYDISAQIAELEYDFASEAIIFNYKQSLLSESAYHEERIRKRKKQIELAIKMPSIYGGTKFYLPGEVPVNDFSYLEGINFLVDIQRQKSLVLNQADISGVVLPVSSVTYVVPATHARQTSLEHLLISDDAEGAIIYDGSSVSSTNGLVLDSTNRLETDGLFAIYNFLQTNIEDTSSTVFSIRNSASPTEVNYAQLVGTSLSNVYHGGLGIPYLRGITRHSSVSATLPSSVGSFVKLPDTKEFNDLLYSQTGATIDFWVHTPNLNSIADSYDDGDVSGLYRIILANENVGFAGSVSSTDTEKITPKFGDGVVRGFLMGFTRDRRLVSGLPASNNTYDNEASAGAFFIAPTQSINSSAMGFLNRSFYDSANCASGSSYHAMVIPAFQMFNGVALSSCMSGFCHISVTFDPNNDLLSVYNDGVLIAASSISTVFATEPYRMPRIPSFKRNNSFEYNSSSVGSVASNALKAGPKLDTFFTPWIVGGGYTDGMALNGNFMGGTYGGIISGLKGYLGSLKFYNKPLTPAQVLNNFNTQQSFFKNIDINVLDQWEDIVSI